MTGRLHLASIAIVLAGGLWSWLPGWPDGAAGSFVEPSAALAQRPWTEADLWLAPATDPNSPTSLESAVGLTAAGRPDEALPLYAGAAPDPVLAPYVDLHRGRALLALERPAAAAAAARRIVEVAPVGYLGTSARWLLAESLEKTGEWTEAVSVWQALSGLSSAEPASVQLRLAQAAEKAADATLAGAAYARVFFEWPAAPEASEAEAALARFPVNRGPETMQLELRRADRLYDARRFADAHRALEQVQARTRGADRQRVDLRLAQCDVHLQRYARGLTALSSYLTQAGAPAKDEAGYFALTAQRGLKRADYPAQVARFVRERPSSAFSEAALNDLATYYVLADSDGRAAEVFTEMYARFPRGAFADRAAWRAGWWAYRNGDYRETVRLFESAATNLRRADNRPGWLYWTARSHEAVGQGDAARLWYLRAVADYRNSYYGREAARRFRALTGNLPAAAAVTAERDAARAVVAGVRPANAALVQRLLAAGLWDDAIGELRFEQAASGTSPAIEATLAYALNRKGELRPAITAMRRAYPQFLSDGGEQLPERILKVIFPVAHRETIRRYAADRRLDLYLVTALVAQESTFQADVVSEANAVGLMQLLPSTGRQYARTVGVSGFTTATLTDPDTNVRLGTAYLADLLARYGDDAAALAAYNAGENRVDRWRAERPGQPRDEFIENIPFPETQNYVKRIIGTAEDYRVLYGAAPRTEVQ